MLDDYGIRDGDTIDVFYQGKGGASNSLWRNPRLLSPRELVRFLPNVMRTPPALTENCNNIVSEAANMFKP